jgi:DNA-binding transcriptional regulator YiaG
MSYADTIKALREKLLLTQMELAAKLGVSYASVNRWENGKCEPTMKAKRKIMSLLKKQGGVGPYGH